MVDKTVNTGAYGSLQVIATEGATDAANNRSQVRVRLILKEKTSAPTTYKLTNTSAFIDIGGGTDEWSGNFQFDWRPSGLQSQTIADITEWVDHNADGSKTVTCAGGIGATGTYGAGGATSVSVSLALTTLKVVPGVPTGLTATRVSDTQVSLAWSQTSASNGQPATNTIQRRVNGGDWATVATIAATTSTTVSASANQKIEYRVRGNNTAGSSAYSTASTPVYTTPAAPSNVAAVKNAGGNIVVTFAENVGYSEYSHEVWHGTVTGGVTTWDGSVLATLATGVLTYTHNSPNPALVHVYRVRSKAGSLVSGYAQSNSVQLLAPPNKPTLPALAPFKDAAVDLVLGWTHNPVDSTPQSHYEAAYSTDGGDNWTSTGKTSSTVSSKTYTGGTWSADDVVLFRVRTWGNATTGGSESTGGSPWSDVRSTTFKTVPVATVDVPADESTLESSTILVEVGFSQAEGASFVSATIVLSDDTGVLETAHSAELATRLQTRAANGGEYTVTVTVVDSNGLTSAPAESTFDVDYLTPATPVVDVVYLPESGVAQFALEFPEPGEGEAAVVEVTITRTIGGVAETITNRYPITEGTLTILDTTPTIHGSNEYTITGYSMDGASVDVVETLTTQESTRVFLSKGPGFEHIVAFGFNLTLEGTPTVDQGLVKAAGRSRPIGLYGRTGDLVVSGSSLIYPTWDGSTPDEIEALLLVPGRACYRDPSGRRLVGQVSGRVVRRSSVDAELSYTVTETS